MDRCIIHSHQIKHHPNKPLCGHNSVQSRFILLTTGMLKRGSRPLNPCPHIQSCTNELWEPAEGQQRCLMLIRCVWSRTEIQEVERSTEQIMKCLRIVCVFAWKKCLWRKQCWFCVAKRAILCVHLRHLTPWCRSCATPPRTITNEVAPDPRCHGYHGLASPWPAASFY